MTLKVNIHIFGLTKYTNYTVKNVPVFVPVLLYAVTMLIFHIKRIISSEKWFDYVVAFLFFLKMPKIWVGRTTLNREKKRGWPYLQQKKSSKKLIQLKNLTRIWSSRH